MLGRAIINHLRRFPKTTNCWYNALPLVNKSHGQSAAVASAKCGQVANRNFHQVAVLYKYNKKSERDVDSDDENEDKSEFKDERDSKVVKTSVNSLRADLLLKAGLGMARNKVENMFYSSKIRVNGEKLTKKSETLDVGDEIDVIRGFSQSNTSHLVISRVIILSADVRDDGFSVTMRRYKSLLIDNYSGVNAYKTSENSATTH